MKALFVAASALALLAACPATAAVVLVTPGVGGTFTEQLPVGGVGSPGVYGVELRGGVVGAADWEIGVGRGTSQTGQFNQGEFLWGALATNHAFSLTWTPSLLSITLDGVKTVTDAGRAAPLTGNTLKIYVKGLAAANVTNVDGTAFNQPITSGQELYFYSSNGFGGDGFTATGTVALTPGGRSRHEVMFKSGTFIAVPEPSAWVLMIGGFGLAGAALRRHRARVACPDFSDYLRLRANRAKSRSQ